MRFPLHPSVPKPRGQKDRHGAFTLIELFAVVAIMGVLAGLILIVLGRVRSASENAQCTSNLRQIGLGTIAFANDNRGRLPGGLSLFQGAYGNIKSKGMLAAFIGPYIDETFHLTFSNREVPLFMCPAWARKRGDPISGSHPHPSMLYLLNSKVKLDGVNIDPWWNGNSEAVDRYAEPNTRTYLQATAELGPNRTWMMAELDQQYPISAAASSSQLIASPPHGTFRHKLYFDAHVVRDPL